MHLVLNTFAELDRWEFYVARTAYIAGETFSFADCAFFPIMAQMVSYGFDWNRQSAAGIAKDAWPHLRRYYERVWERGGKNGCAQKAELVKWNKPGKKVNVFRV